jgi:lambda repressor-like predicted transcriptional regulator
MSKQSKERQQGIREMLAELERTGESIAAFARRRGVATWALYQARRKQRKVESAKVVAVEVTEPASVDHDFELVVDEVTLRIPAAFDEATLTRLIRTLRAC